MGKLWKKTCAICGNDFEVYGSSYAQKYCNTCRDKYFKFLDEWAKAGYPIKTHCVICGAPLPKRTRGAGLKKASRDGECYKLLTTLYQQNARIKREDLMAPRYSTRTKKEPVKRRKPGQMSRLGELEAAARAAGMSYGEYIATQRGGMKQ